MVRHKEQFLLTFQRHSIPSVIPFYILSKLFRYGVYDMELRWFTDYLFLHEQIVQFHGVGFRNQIPLTPEFLN